MNWKRLNVLAFLMISAAGVTGAAAQSTVAGPGGVKAMAEGQLYDQPSLAQYGKIVGSYSSGQEFCAEYTSPPSQTPAFIMLKVDGQTAYAANTPGPFAPDSNNPNCAAARGSAPNWSVIDKFPAFIRPVLFAAQGALLWLVIAALVIALAGAGWLSVSTTGKTYKKYQKWSLRNARPLTAGKAAEFFPGFFIEDGELEFHGKQLFRVNSDGGRINLKRWTFDENTGEFYKKLGMQKDFVIFSQNSYEKRMVALFHGRRIVRGLIITALLGCVLFLIGLAGWTPLELLGGLLVIGAPVLWMNTLGDAQKKGNMLFTYSAAGPQPLRIPRDDYGPDAAVTPINHPASDDLGYKPAT